jgi:hypothetical protein
MAVFDFVTTCWTPAVRFTRTQMHSGYRIIHYCHPGIWPVLPRISVTEPPTIRSIANQSIIFDIITSHLSDSNGSPAHYKCAALPNELRWRAWQGWVCFGWERSHWPCQEINYVPRAGFEPALPSASCWCLLPLGYRGLIFWLCFPAQLRPQNGPVFF